MQGKPERSNGELVEPIMVEVPTQQFVDDLNKRKAEASTPDPIQQARLDENERHALKDYPYRNVFINGKLIKAAKQEVRGYKVVLVDPKGKVVHVLSNNPPKRKKRKQR